MDLFKYWNVYTLSYDEFGETALMGTYCIGNVNIASHTDIIIFCPSKRFGMPGMCTDVPQQRCDSAG